MTITLPIGASRDTLIRVIYQQLIAAGMADLASQACVAFNQAADAAAVLLALVRLSEEIEVAWT